MRRAFIVALACVSLAACGRKHADQQQQAPAEQSAHAPQDSSSVPAPQPQATGGEALSPACPQAPLKSQVESAIKAALNQIYGADEGAAKVSVTAISPSSDCKTITVTYKTSGTSQTAPLVYGDDGKWTVTLFKKQYKVQ
jgi:predicted small lipoprotein YifL